VLHSQHGLHREDPQFQHRGLFAAPQTVCNKRKTHNILAPQYSNNLQLECKQQIRIHSERISTVRLFYEYYQPSKLRAIFHDIVKEECFTLRKEDTITDKVFEKCRLKRLSAFMALLMLGEWPLMVFTGFTMNINGLRGFSQSCTPSHSHLLHTQFSMCLGTRSVGSTAIKHPMQRCYKYQHITFIQPLYPLVEMPIHVVIEWEPVAMWRTEKGSTFNTR